MVKQVIVIRKDLKMRRGKEIAQGAHASMVWLSERTIPHGGSVALRGNMYFYENGYMWFTAEELLWIRGNFAKVCLQVDSEASLMDVYDQAIVTGLTVHLITDSGLTEFDGVPTRTCLAIGPHEAERIDAVTGGLKLY